MESVKVAKVLSDFWKLPIGKESTVFVFGFDDVFFKVLQSYPSKKILCYDPLLSHLKDPLIAELEILDGDIKEILSSRGPFDVILFSPKNPKAELHDISFQQIQEFQRSKSAEKELHEQLQETLEKISQYKYSDEDLLAFVEQIAPSEKKQLKVFLGQLVDAGQISREQLNRFLAQQTIDVEPPKRLEWDIESCLDCLKNHVTDKGCFLGFISEGYSFFNEPLFLEEILSSPDFSFEESACPCDISSYFLQKREAVPKYFSIKRN